MSQTFPVFMFKADFFFLLGDRFPAFAISEIFIYGPANVTDEVWY